MATDEDSNCSTDQNFDAKLSRASVLYQGPSSGELSAIIQNNLT